MSLLITEQQLIEELSEGAPQNVIQKVLREVPTGEGTCCMSKKSWPNWYSNNYYIRFLGHTVIKIVVFKYKMVTHIPLLVVFTLKKKLWIDISISAYRYIKIYNTTIQ